MSFRTTVLSSNVLYVAFFPLHSIWLVQFIPPGHSCIFQLFMCLPVPYLFITLPLLFFFWISFLNYKNHTFHPIVCLFYMDFEFFFYCLYIFIKFVHSIICDVCYTAICTYYLELCFLTEFFILMLDSFLSLLYRRISIIPNNVYYLLYA